MTKPTHAAPGPPDAALPSREPGADSAQTSAPDVSGPATSDSGDGRQDRRALGPPGPPPTGERRRRVVGWQSGDIVRATVLVAAVLITLRLLWEASPLVLTVFLGVLFGLAVEAGVDRLERLRIPRGIGAAFIVLSFYGLLVGMGAWMAPTLRTQAREIRTRLPEAVDKVEGWLSAQQGGALGSLLGGRQVTTAPETARPAPPTQDTAARSDTVAVAVDTAARPAGAAPSATATLRERLGTSVTGAGRYLFPFLTSTVTVIGGIILISVLAVYIGADPDTYHRGLMHLFTHRSRRRAGEVLSAVAIVLRKWLVTQLIAMVAIGAVTTIILLLLDVQAAFALGVLAGLLEFIPTIGPI
ncbi:MAG: AI-2E family transporter, partial [Gemmatimonadota bacterium]|nr:AI-2E family transporter [Gemmatimonadota bacterium]